MPNYDAVSKKQNELIRKGLRGSVFTAPLTTATVTVATLFSADGLATLPTGYNDLGWLTDDGAQFSQDVNTSDMTGWGSFEPVRSDITSKTTTLQVACLETKRSTIELYTGIDTSDVDPDTHGSIELKEPSTPNFRHFRTLSIAVDDGDAGEIYICRFLPRSRVTDIADQNLNSGDDGIQWGVTLTGFRDSTYGSAGSYFFGGPGWKALLEDMGFPAAATV